MWDCVAWLSDAQLFMWSVFECVCVCVCRVCDGACVVVTVCHIWFLSCQAATVCVLTESRGVWVHATVWLSTMVLTCQMCACDIHTLVWNAAPGCVLAHLFAACVCDGMHRSVCAWVHVCVGAMYRRSPCARGRVHFDFSEEVIRKLHATNHGHAHRSGHGKWNALRLALLLLILYPAVFYLVSVFFLFLWPMTWSVFFCAKISDFILRNVAGALSLLLLLLLL